MKKLKSLLLTAAISACPAYVLAWDSNANIDAAMNKMVSIYKANGLDATVAEAKNCYEGLDLGYRTKKTAQDAEYCVAADISTLVIAVQTGYKADPSDAYFQPMEAAFRWSLVLHKAKVFDLPDQFEPYIQPRIQKIKKELPPKL